MAECKKKKKEFQCLIEVIGEQVIKAQISQAGKLAIVIMWQFLL